MEGSEKGRASVVDTKIGRARMKVRDFMLNVVEDGCGFEPSLASEPL
jgi:hypothetical protein